VSRWSGKYVIGLTGNIATGKSVVRKMLEHLGAYGIDADALAHRAMAKGAPGYPLIVKTFGEWILDEEGQIDRGRMAKIAFSDPGVLEKLEAIVHPLVAHAVDLLIQRSQHSVVVIEAIKLLESDMVAGCDTIWVVDAPEAVQVTRLVQKRSMPEAAARQRIAAQPPQSLKLRAAKVVIRNNGSFDETWEQVQAAWAKLPKAEEPLLPSPPALKPGQIAVRRGRPQDADEIARFITRVTHGRRRMSRADVMAAFGEKAYFMVERDGKLTGVAGWQVENLVTRIDELYFEPGLPLDQAIPALMEAVETASSDLQSEASLLFLPPYLAQHVGAWRAVGYKPQTIPALGVRAWQEAAVESMPRGASLWFKRLREERVLRPL
jgi:dephospho-CoA kinase